LTDTKGSYIHPELATIHLGTPKDDLERSLTNNDNVFNDQEKIEFDSHFDTATLGKYLMNSSFEDLKEKGSEETPPQELKPLPSELVRGMTPGRSRLCQICLSTILISRLIG
jgi:hypothetical protein